MRTLDLVRQAQALCEEAQQDVTADDAKAESAITAAWELLGDAAIALGGGS
jgi:hypothetical protein